MDQYKIRFDALSTEIFDTKEELKAILERVMENCKSTRKKLTSISFFKAKKETDDSPEKFILSENTELPDFIKNEIANFWDQYEIWIRSISRD